MFRPVRIEQNIRMSAMDDTVQQPFHTPFHTGSVGIEFENDHSTIFGMLVYSVVGEDRVDDSVGHLTEAFEGFRDLLVGWFMEKFCGGWTDQVPGEIVR